MYRTVLASAIYSISNLDNHETWTRFVFIDFTWPSCMYLWDIYTNTNTVQRKPIYLYVTIFYGLITLLRGFLPVFFVVFIGVLRGTNCICLSTIQYLATKTMHFST